MTCKFNKAKKIIFTYKLYCIFAWLRDQRSSVKTHIIMTEIFKVCCSFKEFVRSFGTNFDLLSALRLNILYHWH